MPGKTDDAAPDRRTYGDACATARALDVIGERWTLLIVRELLFGPKRFGDLQSGLATVRPNVLSQRLRDLEAAQVIHRRRLGMPASVWVYELTDWGRQLEPILLALGEWGRATPLGEAHTRISADALMLALKTHFRPAKTAARQPVTITIGLGGDYFTVTTDRVNLAISRGEPPHADATLDTDADTFKALIIDGEPRSRAQSDGRLTVGGSTKVLDELLAALR
ncbi:winged helix-turn-helix transcriptional regulator [Mycolicibacterium sp. P1-5]|uniref:winged helix-turn-helix transcriptional regulator n=1 Tax=Mycolicibacterium sp. P1-5 TaxID=2024617 RepID=UPI0011EC542B|nr:winged helix-turn-helix transcriptional regulator [Mycolicibacterium sp. P1-5]KAA0110218.1 transcriptional regulator [Mycolicibacterium sp. P1-5]